MNLHELTQTETSYLLFAIKKTLRDRDALTPGMEQFYDSTYDSLSAKLHRLTGGTQGRSDSKERSRDAYVSTSWHPESLSKVSRDLAKDH